MSSIVDLYPVVTVMACSLLTAVGFCLLFLKIPGGEALANYRMSRRLMAVSYLLLAVANGLSVAVDHEMADLKADAFVLLAVSFCQALLFTFSIVTLINAHYVTLRRVVREALPVVVFAGLMAWLYVTGRETARNVVFGIFCAWYVVALIRYTYIYFREEEGYRYRRDNYFAEDGTRQLAWTRTAFLGALLVGVMAFCPLLTDAVVYRMLFTVAYMLYYLYFGINFVNYVHEFPALEPVVVDDILPEKKAKPAGVPAVGISSANGSSASMSTVDFETLLADWVDCKGYLIPGITLVELAAGLHTNRTYLSYHINRHTGMHFNAWITYLRLGEAKRLLTAHPDMPLGEVAHKTGYTDQSTFTRQFTRQEGMSPGAWRLQNAGSKSVP